jgi:hypothetical protein
MVDDDGGYSRAFCFCVLKKRVMQPRISFTKTTGLLAVTALIMVNACKKTGGGTNTGTATGSDTAEVPMGPVRPSTASTDPYVTSFFEYNPAPGQFINTSLGDQSAAAGVVGNTNGLVSLGAWGGYVVYGFDHTVMDQAGPDLLVIGNAVPGFSEPGIIWVMQDQNGNGKPDDTWYELAGAATGMQGYVRNYSVTYTRPDPTNASVSWKDNMGDSGYVLTTMFHTQDYYPDSPVTSSYTLRGTLLPSIYVNTSNPSYVISGPFAYGYSDSNPGGDSMDISNAIDSLGKPVKLKGIDFVKVQTGCQANLGYLGEFSTEVTGIGDLSLLK